jgi:peroxiredoxin
MRLNPRFAFVLFVVLFAGSVKTSTAATQVALQPGQKIPTFELKDQAGKSQTFDSLKGPNGLLLIFSRSADWCPLCKSQLIDFESSRKNFEAKGIRVASVTYDSPEVLRLFAQRRNVNFELLSDPDSKLIDEFGVRNLEVTGSQWGIAIPNYYLITPDGVIRNRWEESTLENRVTANYFYETLYGAGTAAPTVRPTTHAPHLNVILTQSDTYSAPGARVRLAVRLEPDQFTHVYAPGAEANGYRPVKLTLDSSDLYSSIPAEYPKATIIEFPALKEKVPVFESKAVVTQDIKATRSPQSMEEFAAHPDLVIHGVLEYQACTDTICYPPEKVPVQWTLNVRPKDLDDVRVAEELQRK